MSVLVTGFTGKVGSEVAKKLKEKGIDYICTVRNVEESQERYGTQFNLKAFDFTDPSTFDSALEQIDQIFLMYPPGDDLKFEQFLHRAKERNVKHIVYLSVKDVQYLPFIHHFKNEKLIRKLGLPYTFIRAGYFMQNLTDFLGNEIKERQRIFIPAGKGKTSFVDTRDLAEVAAEVFQNPTNHRNQKYVVTGDHALDFYEVAEQMTEVLRVNISYDNPSVKEFRKYMIKKGIQEDFVKVVIGIHFPTKLGLARGISHDYEKLTNKKPIRMKTFIADNKDRWLKPGGP
ncbi:SDR family oxidoreductase [Halobacillus mangrovi]|uniref:SDR family oxidoreductase n=1 Tax=Halobacillus mangrovi TaxID=402384 RepID=UPI003D972141